jgi:hypothetical protein
LRYLDLKRDWRKQVIFLFASVQRMKQLTDTLLAGASTWAGPPEAGIREMHRSLVESESYAFDLEETNRDETLSCAGIGPRRYGGYEDTIMRYEDTIMMKLAGDKVRLDFALELGAVAGGHHNPRGCAAA